MTVSVERVFIGASAGSDTTVGRPATLPPPAVNDGPSPHEERPYSGTGIIIVLLHRSAL